MGRYSLRVSLILVGKAARCSGAGGWWCGGVSGGGEGGADDTAAAGVGACATGSRCSGLLLFGLLTGKLSDAKDKLEAAQFDVAAMVEQGRALPACPAASN